MRFKFVLYALLAAVLYALSTPFSKLLLEYAASNMVAAFLYLGAGVGMTCALLTRGVRGGVSKAPLRKTDAPCVAAMVVLDIAAPLLLMAGLATAPAQNVSLLNNFEIVATAVIARFAFGERIGPRLAAGLALTTAACTMLSVDSSQAMSFTPGSLLVLAACLCWGLENNCTAAISERDATQIVAVKGIGSGTGALCIALACGDALPSMNIAAATMLLGFVAYGLSIYFYILAQSGIGAARTSAYYAVAPFVGAAISWLVFQVPPGVPFAVGLVFMAAGSVLAAPQNSK